MTKISRAMNPVCMFHEGDDDQEEEQVLTYQQGENYDGNKEKETPSRADG